MEINLLTNIKLGGIEERWFIALEAPKACVAIHYPHVRQLSMSCGTSRAGANSTPGSPESALNAEFTRNG